MKLVVAKILSSFSKAAALGKEGERFVCLGTDSISESYSTEYGQSQVQGTELAGTQKPTAGASSLSGNTTASYLEYFTFPIFDSLTNASLSGPESHKVLLEERTCE